MEQGKPQMLTTREVAALFGRHPRSIMRWAKLGILTAVRPTNGKLLYPASQPLIYQQLNRTHETGD